MWRWEAVKRAQPSFTSTSGMGFGDGTGGGLRWWVGLVASRGGIVRPEVAWEIGGSAPSAPSAAAALVEGAPPTAVPMGGSADLPGACAVSDTAPGGASAGGCMMKRPPVAAASAPPPVTIAACPTSSGDSGAPGKGGAACSAALGARAAHVPLGPAFTALLVAAPPALASTTSPTSPASSIAANVDALPLSLSL